MLQVGTRWKAEMLDLTTEYKLQLSAAQKKNKELKEKIDFLKVKIFKKLLFITGKWGA
jgi:hypothetical protein